MYKMLVFWTRFTLLMVDALSTGAKILVSNVHLNYPNTDSLFRSFLFTSTVCTYEHLHSLVAHLHCNTYLLLSSLLLSTVQIVFLVANFSCWRMLDG